MAGNLVYKDEKTLQRLLMYDYFRGQDSTGVAQIKKDGGHKIAKIASHPLDLFDTGKWKEAVSAFPSAAWIGHNRAATKGVVNTVNAHPYEFDHIIGAHNGTLTVKSHQDLEELAGEKFNVDSMAIFAAIAKVGIEETMKVMQGAWSLVWYDKQKERLCFLRNKERPMWYTYTKDFKKLLWASEYQMIRAANELQASPDELFKSEEGFTFYQTSENYLYEVDLKELAKGSTEKPKTRVKELKGKEPAPVGTVGFTGRNTSTDTTGGNTTTMGPHSQTSRSNFPRSRTSDLMSTVVSLYGTVTDPFAGLYEKEEFDVLAKDGCDWCGGPLVFGEPGTLMLGKTNQILCPSCSTVPGDASIRVMAEDIKKFM